MRYKLLKIVMFLLITGFVACKKDNKEQQPNQFSVKVTQNVALPYIVNSSKEINFDLSITSASALKIKDAELMLDGSSLKLVTAGATNQVDLKHVYKVSIPEVGKSLIFKLKVSSEEGELLEKDFVVYVESAPANISVVIPNTAPVEIKDTETADFNISVKSEYDFWYIKTFLNQVEVPALSKTSFTNPKEDTYQFTYHPLATDVDKTLEFYIEVMDVMGNMIRQPFTLAVKRSQVVDFNVFPNLNLGAQRCTTAGPFFNAATGQVYPTAGSAQISASIDLSVFYSGSTNSYNITSPTLASVSDNIYTVAAYGADAMANWLTRNKTLMKKIVFSQNDFDLISSTADITALYENSLVVASETSGGMANGNVIVFKTAGNKYGVLIVKSRSANANTGFITVDIKVGK
jgi:hypothetical protein